MADTTGIQWTDSTWNPLAGCSIVSPACTNCYAMAQAARIVRCAAGLGRTTHYAETVTTVKGKPVWTGEIRAAPDHILTQPLRWRRPRRIFVNSMSDLFHEAVPEALIDRVFAVMALAPQHTFQVLTKRPERMRAYLMGYDCDGARRFHVAHAAGRMSDEPDATSSFVAMQPWPLSNVWLGVTAERQQEADERIPILLDTPAEKRFVSIEPMLGPVDLRRITVAGGWYDALSGWRDIQEPFAGIDECLDWVICGGESGHAARPMHPDWARSLRDQCAAAGTAFFFKQWGEWAPLSQTDGGYWPTDTETACRLRVDGTRGDDGWPMQRVGKARAGRVLDGVEHNAFPEE